MPLPDESEAVVTDVVAPARPVGPAPPQLRRVRCTSCGMPVRGSLSTCWSCGLDPTHPLEAETTASAQAPSAASGRSSAQRLLAVAGLALVLVVLLGCLALLSSPDRRGVRGLAARVRGDGWQRAEVAGASAEFPAAPVHRTLALGGDRPRQGEWLAAETPSLRTELVVADLADLAGLAGAEITATAGGASRPEPTEQLLSAYAAAVGGHVTHQSRIPTASAGLDALVARPGDALRVRVTMAGTTGYLLAVAGPAEAFDRFAESFQPVATRPGARFAP